MMMMLMMMMMMMMIIIIIIIINMKIAVLSFSHLYYENRLVTNFVLNLLLLPPNASKLLS
jgi:hypothetical protein